MEASLGTKPTINEAVPSLIEQASGMHRNEAMKAVVGPALAELLYPTYDPWIRPEPEPIPQSHLANLGQRIVGLTRITARPTKIAG
jgi:hypothetical protein